MRALPFLFLSVLCVLCSVLCTPVHAEPLKVSIIIGDHQSKPTIEAVKEINKAYPELKDQISWGIYVQKSLGEQERAFISQSRLVLVFIMGRELADAVSGELRTAIGKGAKVYSFGGTHDDDHRAMGILNDEDIKAYSISSGGRENMRNMILTALKKGLDLPVVAGAPVASPRFGIYDRSSQKVHEEFEAYKRAYPAFKEERPWVGIVFYKNAVESGQTAPVDAVIERLEAAGFNVLPVFGYPAAGAIERFFFDSSGKSRVNLVVAMGMKLSMDPAVVVPLLSRLNVPVINAISLYGQSREEWEKSPVGLSIFERAWQIANPEMTGLIQPTVIASKEQMRDSESGIEYIEESPVPERVESLVQRVKAWINLQEKPNRDKNVALIYYNYPPGKQNIGAAYLNVLPESLWEMLLRLKEEGYVTDDGRGKMEQGKERLFHDVHSYGRNIGNWAQGEIDRLARSGKAVLIPTKTYKKWFAELPEKLREAVIKSWGPVEKSSIMTWKGASGTTYLVIPAVRYGNILLTPQPARGWGQDPVKMYHDVSSPPHHQYIAFYLWLKHGFKADAVAHIGTHGTHEWLSGKEIGFTEEDPPEALIQDLPNIYPYIVDDVGEGIQAKRRGMAVVIDYMTPPFDKAGMNRELKELAALISDYNAAKEKSPGLADSKMAEIKSLAQKTGILKDLGLTELGNDEELEELEHYIKEIAEKQSPFGLHTFGKPPEEKYIKTTAEAVVSIEEGLSDEERKKKVEEMEQRILLSGKRELNSFVAALSGRYIPSGQGNDPIRNPDSLPTGKNFYAFDPTRIPSPGIYKTGKKLAEELIEGYKQRKGSYPDRLAFNLWAVETITNEGVMESQILSLMGMRPRWDERGRVIGLEVIPRAELGRQRIDVTIVPSGLYRDLFPNLMDLLDKAVTLAKGEDEEDNSIRKNIIRTREMLLAKGIAEEKAERLASVRIFTEVSGSYGNGLETVITNSNTWTDEKKVVNVLFNRMGFLYGQGFWGEKGSDQPSAVSNQEDMGIMLFKNALSGVKMAVLGRSSNLIASLDNDDVYQYLGGIAMAVRAVDGKSPEVYISNLANPKAPKQESLDKYMGREMRSRYLNPEWIKVMMKEGYEGARFVDKVVENLWGWQVTVPEAVDAAKWNEIYETYVLDRNGLGIKELFKDSKNLWAYQSIVARMLETARKEYWKPDKEVLDTLAKEYAETAKEVGLACCDHTCNNPLLTEFTSATLLSVPGMKPLEQSFRKALDTMRKPQQRQAQAGRQQQSLQRESSGSTKAAGNAPAKEGAAKTKTVEGFEMEERSMASGASSAPIPWLFILGFLVFIGLVVFGFRKRRI